MKKKIISGIITAGLVFTMVTPAFATDIIIIPPSQTSVMETQENPATSFSDVSSSHWAYNDIMTIVNKGAVAGTTTPVNGVGTYNPEGKVTLGQFLAISTRLVASDKIQEGNYTHWATPNYVAAIESNLIRSSDFSNTKESLDANISREDMAYILVNIAKANGETLEVKAGIQNKIKDFNSISPERQNVVLQAYSNGLLAGDNLGNFSPKATATRAQIAAVFCRVMNYVERPSVSVDNPGTTNPGSTINSGYVSNEGQTKGMLIPQYSRQYDLQALQGIRVGSDSKGVYVTFTAPQLPTEISKDFTFQFGSNLYDSNGDYFASKVNVALNPGESKTVYDEQILEKLKKNKKGASFLEGKWSDIEKWEDTTGTYIKAFPSQSEADFSFACLLLYFNGNQPVQAERLFLQSGMWSEKRKHKKSSGYVQHTIAEASLRCSRVFDWDRYSYTETEQSIDFDEVMQTYTNNLLKVQAQKNILSLTVNKELNEYLCKYIINFGSEQKDVISTTHGDYDSASNGIRFWLFNQEDLIYIADSDEWLAWNNQFWDRCYDKRLLGQAEKVFYQLKHEAYNLFRQSVLAVDIKDYLEEKSLNLFDYASKKKT